ncbi:MAG: N-acetylmuramoyl-L-alanine amidase [Thermoanaerobaculia bacterium]
MTANDPALRKRLLREAVEENVRTIANRPRGKLYRRPPVRWIAVLATAAGIAAAGGVGAWRAWWAPAHRELATSLAATVHGPRARGGALAPSPLPASFPSTVLPLAIHRIAIDAGHGGPDLGTHLAGGLAEKDVTLDVARRLAAALAAAGYETVMTRSEDRRVTLRERARIANDGHADLFVSIHVNWFQDGRRNNGVETFYLGPTEDPEANRVASVENRESGFALADARRLLDRIYADLKREESGALALAVQRRLLATARGADPKARDRGVKTAPFLVLVAADVPAVLAEISSLANEEEARRLAEPEYRQRIAQALFEGIQAYSQAVQNSGERRGG